MRVVRDGAKRLYQQIYAQLRAQIFSGEIAAGQPLPSYRFMSRKYQVNVDRVELTRAQTSGNPMLKWTLRILAPTHKGRLLWRNNVMASNENIKWLKQDLYTCGLQLQKLSDLPGHLEQLLNIKLEVTKRTRGENENIYFNRRIVMADDAGAPGAAMDDMIPF